jgi:hypothetical protein
MMEALYNQRTAMVADNNDFAIGLHGKSVRGHTANIYNTVAAKTGECVVKIAGYIGRLGRGGVFRLRPLGQTVKGY